MCGICGFLNTSEAYSKDSLWHLINRMNHHLVHRGPDDSGILIDTDNSFAFGHRRLSIQDLSNKGRQPFIDARRENILIFNGEIYNFKELKLELKQNGISFVSDTDTEVLMEALKLWGKNAFEKLDGMFAFAFHNIKNNTTLLARDPFGEKPLYWSETENGIAFASELTALTCLKEVNKTVSNDAIASYLFLQYFDAPLTLYKNIYKLKPGYWMEIQDGQIIGTEAYYTFLSKNHHQEQETTTDLDVLADKLESILLKSLKRRLIADVPIGAFLSGGLDSSLIVALIRKKLGLKIHTFSAGFSDTHLTEHHTARRTAEYLGTIHHEKIITPEEIKKFNKIIDKMDEPNADTSCLPYYFLSEFARNTVKVIISGDGADELFAGYSRYLSMNLAYTENTNDIGNIYYTQHLAIWNENQFLDQFPDTPYQYFKHRDQLYCEIDCSSESLLNRLRKADINHYLPGSVLAKVDRMSMTHGLEVRTPFLCRELADFVEQLKPDLLIEPELGKKVLRHLAKRYLPEEWLTTEKTGFSIPNDTKWLKSVINYYKPTEKPPVFLNNVLTKVNIDNLFQYWSLYVLIRYLEKNPASFERNSSLLDQFLHQKPGITDSRLNYPDTTTDKSPLIYDQQHKCLLPYCRATLIDDVHKYTLIKRTNPILTEQCSQSSYPLFRGDTPARSIQLIKEACHFIYDYFFYESSYKQLKKIVTKDNTLKISPTNKNIVFITHDLASGGAQRQLCLNAIAAKELGYNVSVIILWPLTGNNIHYLSMLNDNKIPVKSSAYPHSTPDENFLSNLKQEDRSKFVNTLENELKYPLWYLMTYLSVLKPDYIHCFVDISCILGGLSAILLNIPKVIFSFRNKNPSHFSFGQPFLRSYYLVLKNSRRIIFTGNSLAGNTDYAQWINLPSNKIHLVRNAIKGKKWAPITPYERFKARTLLEINQNIPCILGVFQLEHYKRPFFFLDVVKKIKSLFKQDFIVLVAGNGQLRSLFQHTINKYELNKQVFYLGNRSDIPDLLAASDLLLFTSGLGEGTPNVIIEAQSRGIPVVTTEAGGGPGEVVTHKKNGFLFNDNDINGLAKASIQLLTDKNLSQEIKRQAIKNIKENYSFDTLKKQLDNLYKLN